jgi:hypothetical protein
MPTIIDELTMTLALDPGGFKEGAEEAQTASDSLLAKMLATLQAIEARTKETAANTAKVQKTAAEVAAEEADKAEKAQTAAAKRAAKEQEDAAKKSAEQMRLAGRQMEEAFGKVGASIRRVGVEMLAMLGISMSVAAMERLFMGINKANTEAGYLARSIGGNVEALQAWQKMADRMGGSAEGVAAAFRTISHEEQAFHFTGMSNLPTQARELFGVDNMVNAQGGFLQGPELAKALAAGARRKGLTAAQIQFAAEQMNIGGLAPIIQTEVEQPGEIDRQAAFQQRSGNISTPEEVSRSRELVNNLKDLHSWITGLVTQISNALTPSINEVVKRINAWIERNREWLTQKVVDWVTDLGKSIVKLADDFDKFINSQGFTDFTTEVKQVATSADDAAKAMGGWGTVIEGLAVIWGGSKVIAMIGWITRLGAAMTVIASTAGAVTSALAVLGATFLGNKMGQEDTYKRAEEEGYTVDRGGPFSMPSFTKNGETIDFGEMQRRLGYGPYGQTMGQSFGFGRPPLQDQGPARSAAPAPGGAAPAPSVPALGLSMPSDLGPAVGLSPEQVNAFASTLGRRESGNRYDIMGGSSGRFAGRWQMGADEIRETARQLNEPEPTRAQFLADPAMQDRFFQRYTLAHHEQLMQNPAYRAQTPEQRAGTLATAHLLGVGGANRQLAGGNAGADAFGTTGSDYARTVTEAVLRARIAETPSRDAPATPPASAAPGYVSDYSMARTPPSAPVAPPVAPPPLPSRPAAPEPPRLPTPSLVPSPAAIAAMAPSSPIMAPSPLDAAAARAPMLEPVGAATAAQGFQASSTTSNIDRSQSSETHIAALHVHTAATDAAGIAKDIRGELKRYDYAAQADTGLA